MAFNRVSLENDVFKSLILYESESLVDDETEIFDTWN